MNVYLREWKPEDREILASVCSQADRKYLSDRLPNPYTAEDGERWISHVSKEDGKTGVFRAVEVWGTTAGNISVERNPDFGGKDGEIGYLYLPEWCGKGVATKAAGLICSLAFETLELLRITGRVLGPNAASRRVLEKNGFRLEGVMRKAVVKDGRVYDMYLYGLLREEWERGNAAGE